MGKALIFEGVIVTDPLDTITILTPDSDAERIANYFILNGEQFAALNSLVKSIKTAGAWNKMKYLMLPMIANSVEEAAQNVLLTNNRVPNTTNLTFENGNLFSSKLLNLTDFVQGMESFNPCSYGWCLNTDNYPFQEEKLSQSVIVIGASRLSRGRASGSSTVETWNVNVNYLPDGGTNTTDSVANLSKFAAFSYYEEGGDVKADKIVGDNETAVTSTIASNATFGNNIGSNGLQLSSGIMTSNYGVTYNGGYKIFWMSEILTTLQLESVHKAFKTFIDALENLSE